MKLIVIRQTQDVLRGRHVWTKVLSLALFAASFSDTVYAQADSWRLRGFESEELNDLIIDPKDSAVLYAAAKAGVFKSVDSGGTWKALKVGPKSHTKNALVVDPQDPSVVYVLDRGIDNLVMYRSADAGESWSEVTTDLNPAVFKSSGVSSLVIDPKEPAKLYLIGPDLWVSEDRGKHWLRLASYESPVLTLVIDPKESSTLYLGTANQDAKKSTDGGKRWRNLAVLEESPFSILSIVINPENSSVLYVATPNGVYKSTNAGESWTAINNGLELNERSLNAAVLAMDLSHPSTLYLGVNERVFVSTSHGESWIEAGTGLPQSGVIRKLVLNPKNSSTLYAGGTRGLWLLQRGRNPRESKQPRPN